MRPARLARKAFCPPESDQPSGFEPQALGTSCSEGFFIFRHCFDRKKYQRGTQFTLMHGDVKDDCRDQGAVAVVGIGTRCSCGLVWEWADVHGGNHRQDVNPTIRSIARVDVRGLLLPDDDTLKTFSDENDLHSNQVDLEVAGRREPITFRAASSFTARDSGSLDGQYDIRDGLAAA